MTSEENQKPDASDSLPIWTDALNAPDLNASPELVSVAKEQFASMRGRPEFVPWYSQFSTDLQVALQNALLRKESPEDAMKPLVDQVKQLASGQK